MISKKKLVIAAACMVITLSMVIIYNKRGMEKMTDYNYKKDKGYVLRLFQFKSWPQIYINIGLNNLCEGTSGTRGMKRKLLVVWTMRMK